MIPLMISDFQLVMTAEIFRSMLSHGYIHLRQVINQINIDRTYPNKTSLLVFDECHHACNRHPYHSIMMDFYKHCPVDQQPRIMGLTASPVQSGEDVVTAIA